ncbi:MAG: hypothetical protein RBU30_27690, partial [Polyangia bacterium]|nr:hypothetical protein [Polyangia bacterium]
QVSDLVRLGSQIDAGMTTEAAMISLASTTLRPQACGFSLSEEPDAVFGLVTALQQSLLRAFDKLARKQPVSTLGELVRRIR